MKNLIVSQDKQFQTCYNKVSEGEINPSLTLFKKRIWRVEDVAKYIGCSKGHIYNLVAKRRIPKVKKGKFLYFLPTDIHNWILEGNYND